MGETVRLGGPVAHVYDVDVDLDRLARSAGVAAMSGPSLGREAE
jgi:hypothetical protein